MIDLKNVDCMDYMKTCKDNEFDLAICDPPYGLGIDGQKENIKGKKSDRKHHVQKDWDSSIPSKEYFLELERVSKNQIIWGANYFVEHLTKGTKGWIVWDKQQHGLTMSDCELAYSSFNYPTRVFLQNRCILKKDGTIHPTQKPIRLYDWILDKYSKKGERILDTHGGSMSSAIAAHYFGVDMVLCEIDKEYYDNGVERFNRDTAQQDIFCGWR